MSATAEEVNRFHEFDDVDDSQDSHHHTLGEGPTQAASGAVVKELARQLQEATAYMVGLEERILTLETP